MNVVRQITCVDLRNPVNKGSQLDAMVTFLDYRQILLLFLEQNHPLVPIARDVVCERQMAKKKLFENYKNTICRMRLTLGFTVKKTNASAF